MCRVWNAQAVVRATDQRRAETGSVDRLRYAKAGFAKANTLETAEEADVLDVAGDENVNFKMLFLAPYGRPEEKFNYNGL